MLHKTIETKISMKILINLLKDMFGHLSGGFVGVALGVSTDVGARQGGVMRSSGSNPFTTTQAVSFLSAQTFCAQTCHSQLVCPIT